jgi:tetratricopeptide (TPR) repeat protein
MPRRVNQRGVSRNRQPRKTGVWLALIILGIVLCGVGFVVIKNAWLSRTSAGSARVSRNPLLESEQAVFAAYGGSGSCRECHSDAYDLWAGSNHGLAERTPNTALDHAAFVPARHFGLANQQTGVGMEGTNFLVTCVGLSRSNETHSVVRVIGNDPLRQFLVAFPGGRLQTLEASYDPNAKDWFDVYGTEDRRPGEWGHWTGRGMNWNNMCAGCHNTRVRKNYEPDRDIYQTRMAGLTVGCEACHGPLKAHNEWQRQHGKTGQKDPTVRKFSRQQVLDYCGFCHARRTDLTGDFKPGDSFFDHQSLTIVDQSDRYYPDGQVREEDYEFAAFLGSRMHTNGVTCLDCHNPHSAKTLLPGNWLCLRCHNGTYTNAPVIEPVTHSHHKVFGYSPEGKLVNSNLLSYNPKAVKETGGECVNCHMPQTVYMQRHWRHDHGFTIPDPLLTTQLGIPNACNRCHRDQSPDWALDACGNWYGTKMERPTRWRAQTVARARNGDPQARDPLLSLLRGTESPYWKAVAAGLLGQWIGVSQVRESLLATLNDPHPLPREQAIRALEPLVDNPRMEVAATVRKLLDDPVRSVRVSAAWALRNQLPAGGLAARELDHYLAINADQPTGQMQEAAYAIAKGEPQKAIEHYAKAIAWDPNSAPIRHDFAVVLSTLGRTREAVEQLEAACRLEPKEAEYEFKLGLAWNELGVLDKTLAALQKAVDLDPRHARAWLNLGLAQNSNRQSENGLQSLLRAEALLPEDPQIPYARATILAGQGRSREARQAAERALQIDPSYSDARKLIEALSTSPRGNR